MNHIIIILNNKLDDLIIYSSVKVETGVPQSLSPLFFIFYINDLLTNIPCDTILSYTDDGVMQLKIPVKRKWY